MSADLHEKLDTALLTALRTHEAASDADPDDGISVSLRFEGDLAPIEALGFETHAVTGTDALGVVRFRDIGALVEHPGVLWIAAGSKRRPQLDTAVRDVRARASGRSGGTPTDGLWDARASSGAPDFLAAPNASGAGVIVAIIDTGIDYKHPMFMSQLTPTLKSRIVRIWDQGLTPTNINVCPDASLLVSSGTYGAEFKNDTPANDRIDANLNADIHLMHKDCDGHGTHVAGIAAGGYHFPSGGDVNRVGVAPEADLIVVKHIDTKEEIRFKNAGPGFGAQVGQTAQLRDAIMYCLRTAKQLGKPVVINMSFGDNTVAGDGLDDDAIWVDDVMDPTHAADNDHFPTGAVVVKAAGNDGDIASDRQTAHIVVPAGGTITVPVELTDTRGGLNTRWEECRDKVHKPPIGVTFWYRRPVPHTAVRIALRLPNQASFSGDMGIGGHLDRGFVPRVGQPPAIVSSSASVHSAFVRHDGPPAVAHTPGGTTLRRHRIQFWVEPKVVGGTVSYHPGIYELRITAPQDTELFAMSDVSSWAKAKAVGCRIAGTMQNGSALHGNIDVTNPHFSATDTLGRHVITVAAYDETNSNHIAAFSSRGPLRDFSNPALGPIAPKPDIAAPGVKIDSAESLDGQRISGLSSPPSGQGIRFIKFNGTSMAAPLVAGAIALMLDKKPDLNTTQVRNLLNTAATARGVVNPSSAPAATEAYGSGMIDALPTHNSTP